jgi:hypothetical protein
MSSWSNFPTASSFDRLRDPYSIGIRVEADCPKFTEAVVVPIPAADELDIIKLPFEILPKKAGSFS